MDYTLPKFTVTRTKLGLFNTAKPCDEAEFNTETQEWELPGFCLQDIGWFTTRYGTIVLDHPNENKFEIEIYDDYRE